MQTFLSPFRQLLSPNIQQKHYHVGGYLVDGNRHVSVIAIVNGDGEGVGGSIPCDPICSA